MYQYRTESFYINNFFAFLTFILSRPIRLVLIPICLDSSWGFFFSVLFILCSNSFFFFYISFSLSVAVYSYLPINRSDTFLSLFLSFLFCCAVVLFYLPLGLYALKCSRTLSRFSSYEITKHLFPANVSKMCLLGLCLRHDNQ